MIRRRDVITLLGGAAAGGPLTARAQQPSMPVIGFLSGGSPDTDATTVAAFRQGLKESGFVEGQNAAIEYRWANGENDRLPALAADLVRRQVSAIASIGGIPAVLAAKAATNAIPVVFYTGGDPVGLGIVASLRRPGGNLTGVTTLGDEVGPKRLELMRQLLPTATVLGLLVNPTNPGSEAQLRIMRPAAHALGLELPVLNAGNEQDFDAAFASASRVQAKALVISPDSLFISPKRSAQLAALAERKALPVISFTPNFPAAGGLMSYGSDGTESQRQVGRYVGRILKGEKPADLPVQQAAKVALIINLKTAKTLSLTVPLALLTRADEVIE